MEVAVVSRGVFHHRGDLGFGTSQIAEWSALLYALDVARDLGARDVVLVGDAANVIDQANGRMKCGGVAREYAAEFADAAAGFVRVRVRHVRRGQNLAGIALARLVRA